MRHISLLDGVPADIKRTLIDPKISEKFEEACMEILTDSELGKKLGRSENELPKVAYAKILLSRETYEAI